MTPVAREHPPAPAPLRPFELPAVTALKLSSGVELRCARLPRMPIVTVALVLPARESALDPAHAGLAVLTASALDGGTTRREGRELADAFEALGTALTASAGWDATTVSFTSTAERVPDVIALLAEVIAESAFPDGELQRARDQQLARIRQRSTDPSSLGNDWASKLIYAEGAPYGRPAIGTTDTVASLERAHVASFAQQRYRPRGAGVVLAGDVDPQTVAALIEDRFASWQGAPSDSADHASGARALQRRVHLVHRPGALQSEIRVGHPGPPRSDPDHFDLVVANTALGGAFTSRLNVTLRERHGYTYGARSRFSFRRGHGPFVASTSVGTAVTAPAIAAMVAELEGFAADGPTEAEIEAARDYVAGVFPLRMESTAQVAGHAAELLIYDLPADHHERYRERIRGVTVESAKAAIQRHLRPSEAAIVVVGDADVVRAPLEALGLGPLEVHVGNPF